MTPFRSTRLAAVVAATLVVVLPAWSAAPAPAMPAGAARDSGRPVVLMLPGRGLDGTDTANLRRDWSGALDRGIAAVAGEPFLERGDLRLVWYADALEPDTEGCAVREREEDGAGRHGEQSGVEWARDVGAALESAGTAGALARAEREGRPVILVAHSFGALVAYHHLLARPDGSPRIERWITVGSLLGHPELREVLLSGGGEAGVPGGVGSWVNVRDPRDPLAARLVGIRSSTADTVAIEDRTTESPATGNPHDPERYLSDPATARAVVEAWCRTAVDASIC